MTNTAYSGPIVQFGVTLSSTSGDGIYGQDLEHNPSRAPMITDLGDAMLDPRQAYAFEPGGTTTNQTFGFYNNSFVVDYVPTTASTVALVVNTASSGVSTFTLAAASSANATYSTTIIAPETGKVTGTLIAIDSTAAYLTLTGGTNNPFVLWNPAAGTGRNVTITPSSNLDGGFFTVAGRDMYGYKVTESVAAGSTNLTTQKAFKYISSITNCTTPTSTGIQIGIGNTYGYPAAVSYVGLNVQTAIIATAFGSTVAVATLPSSVNTILASTRATQVSTSPDVRGTYASTTAANNTIRLQMYVTPTAQVIASVTSTNVAPLFGGTQFSSV